MHKYAVAPFVSGVRYGSAAVYLCLQLLCVNLRTHKHDRFLSTCLQNAGLLYKPLRVSMCACEFGCVPPFPVCLCVWPFSGITRLIQTCRDPLQRVQRFALVGLLLSLINTYPQRSTFNVVFSQIKFHPAPSDSSSPFTLALDGVLLYSFIKLIPFLCGFEWSSE